MKLFSKIVASIVVAGTLTASIILLCQAETALEWTVALIPGMIVWLDVTRDDR